MPNKNITVEPEIKELSAQALDSYQSMLSKVPEGGGGSADNIILQLAEAKTVKDLDRPWETNSFANMDGKIISVTDIKRMVSDFDSGFGYYLVVTYTDGETGEVRNGITGSVSIVAQLIRAYTLGAFPVSCLIKKSERPSKNGFYPMHLIFNY
jgi:hypothetical protein